MHSNRNIVKAFVRITIALTSPDHVEINIATVFKYFLTLESFVFDIITRVVAYN